MWRLEIDPTFSSSFATVTLLDRPADIERLRRRLRPRRRASCPGCASASRTRPLGLAPVWVDVADVDLDHHVRHVTLPAPGTAAPAARPGHRAAGRPVRPRRGRCGSSYVVDGARGRPGRVHPEDAPHASPTARTASRSRCSSSTSSATAPEPPPLTDGGAGRRRARAGRRRRPTRSWRRVGNGVRFSTGGCTQVTEPACSIRRRLVRDRLATVGERVRGTVSTLPTPSGPTRRCGPTARSAATSRCCRCRSTPVKDGRPHARRHPQHRVPHRRRRRRRRLPPRAGRAGRQRCGPRWPSAPGRKESGAERLHPGPPRACPRARWTSAERFAAIHAAADAVRASAAVGISLGVARRPGRRAADVAARAPGPPAVRARSTSPPPTCARRRSRCTSPAPASWRNYPVGPLAGVAFNLTLLCYCGSLDMGLHVDPPR